MFKMKPKEGKGNCHVLGGEGSNSTEVTPPSSLLKGGQTKQAGPELLKKKGQRVPTEE